MISDESVVRQGNTRTVDFPVPSFVDEMADRLEVRFAVGDVWLDDLEHFLGRLGEFDEYTIIDLEKTQELQYFSGFRGHFVDTVDVSLEWKEI